MFRLFSQLRLISYSSVDSFIKRDYVLDILDKYKVNPRILEHLQRQANDVDLNIFDWKLEGKRRRTMNKEKGLCVQQHRREYYNDFEDCIRDYKIRSIQKQTKVHLSDGDNGESDSDYVDCNDGADLRHQTTHKSMPHVPSSVYQDSLCQQLEPKAPTMKQRNENDSAQKAQLNTNYNVSPVRGETPAQLTSPPHKNDYLNRIIDGKGGPRSIAAKVRSVEKSISIDDNNTRIPVTSSEDIKLHVNQNASVTVADKQSKSSEAGARPSPVQITGKRDEPAATAGSTKRRSCKKRQPEVVAVAVKDPTQQRWYQPQT